MGFHRGILDMSSIMVDETHVQYLMRRIEEPGQNHMSGLNVQEKYYGY